MYVHNKYYLYNKGLITSILWELCFVQTTQDARQWTMDNAMDIGRWTMNAGPSAPYYKLTGELKTAFGAIKSQVLQVAPP